MSLKASLRVRAGGEEAWHECAGVLLAPGASLEVAALTGPLLIGFLDPRIDLATARCLDERNLVTLPNAVVERWRRTLGDPAALDYGSVDAWIRSEFANRMGEGRIHPRVRRVVRYLSGHDLDRQHTSLSCLASVAQLSPSRLMHVFTESLGMPLRPYLLLIRVRRAAVALDSGHTVTEAAHIAGFADASHLARTVRRILGVTPGQLAAHDNGGLENRLNRTHDLTVSADRSTATLDAVTT